MKCPWCGSRRTFIKRWLGRYERCRTCGIRWHREQGFELGPLALNLLVTFLALAIGMIIVFVSTAPDFPVVPMTVGFMVGAVVVPLILYPITNTVWLAVDLLAHRPDQGELAEAADAVDQGTCMARE